MHKMTSILLKMVLSVAKLEQQLFFSQLYSLTWENSQNSTQKMRTVNIISKSWDSMHMSMCSNQKMRTYVMRRASEIFGKKIWFISYLCRRLALWKEFRGRVQNQISICSQISYFSRKFFRFWTWKNIRLVSLAQQIAPWFRPEIF